MGDVFVIEDGFIRATKDHTVSGTMAVDENGIVVATSVGSDTIVTKLLELGYLKEDIYFKVWASLTGKVRG